MEDELINQKVGMRILQRLGCAVEVAKDGGEAISAMQERVFDLVLMDCDMPVMDGFEATRQIRQLPTPANRTPVIALTANAMKGNRKKCLDAGMNDYLTKPLKPEQLHEMLQRWCPKRKQS